MGLIQDQPEDLPSSNDLDNVEDPDEADERTKQRTEVYLSGAHVFTLDHAPSGLERFTFQVDVEVYEAGGVRFTGEDGETQVAICKVRRIGDMYLPGTQRPPSKDELAAITAAAKAKAAAEKAAQEDAERAESEQNEPPMFDDKGDPLDPDAPKPPTEDEELDSGQQDAAQQDAEDQGDADPPPALAVVGPAFSDGGTK